MMQEIDPLERFLGAYDVARRIEDRLTAQVVRFVGTANLERVDQGVLYEETGALIQQNGARFAAQRRYVWTAQAALIAVQFEDGRAFHTFDPVRGGAAQEHLCGEDLYRGSYNFAGWPEWSLTWDVTGPRKHYLSVTRFSKIL